MSDARGAATGTDRIVPYALVFLLAAFLLYRAENFEYTATAEQIGPDSWPKLVLYLIMATSAFEGLRRFWAARRRQAVRSERPIVESPFERGPADIRVMIAVVAAALVYLNLFEIVGFFIDTVVFIFALILIGQFRRPWVALAISVSATLFFMLVFLRVIFVALPIGIGPFASLSTNLMRLLGVH